MRKKGSAILTVIGSISILVVLAFSFIGSSREKTVISKLMSDEKKVEALAESTTDCIIKYIKNNANIHEDTPIVNNKNEYLEAIYYLLRAPLKNIPGSSGDNFKLDVSNAKPVKKIEEVFDYKKFIDSSIKEIGWDGKVEITSKLELVDAEYFTPFNLSYQVPNIDKEHLPAEGKSAKFLDDINGSYFETPSSDWSENSWKLRMKFPSGDPTYEEYSTKAGILHVTLKVSREREEDTRLHLKAQIWKRVFGKKISKTKTLDDFDVQEKIDDANFFPKISPKTLQGLANGYTKGTPDYNFSNYVNDIKERKTYLNNKYQTYINDFDIDNTDLNNKLFFIEKGAILRITTNVIYKKSDNENLEKTLVTEIPFKVSDVQPIAPEYSFFVANSKKVSEQSDIYSVKGEAIHQLGEPFDLNKNTFAKYNDTPPAGEFIVHNLPINDGKIDYDEIKNGTRIPGMVRVNTVYTPTDKKVTKIKSFLGLLDKPEYNELKKFFTPFEESFTVNKYNTRVSFCWDNITKLRYHEIELPFLFEKYKHNHDPGITGIKNMLNIMKQSGFEILSVPTLLFGICHMEYPLGLIAEGPIDTEYSRLRITVKIKLNWLFKDRTEVIIDYEPISTYSNSPSLNSNPYPYDNSGKDVKNGYDPSTFGMQTLKGYNPNGSWNSNNDYKYSPANCYDALQYAKKATKFYESGKDLTDDMKLEVAKGGLKDTDGTIKLNGVYYVKNGGLLLDLPIKYKGHGLIVCKKGIIEIKKDITRADNQSSLGIISRTCHIKFNTNNVTAACFSNNAPICTTSKLNLYGNLVSNNFVRENFLDAHIFYDNSVCNVTPFASLRNIGKFEPKRYVVTFADNWSKYNFEKPKPTETEP